MPVVDGFEAIRRIRAQRWGRDIVICTLTGFTDRSYCQRSQALGANHHFIKPADLQTLASVLR
jgi:YesN/AraC family two-component response regulator